MRQREYPVTWILLADGQSARGYECRNGNGATTAVPDFTFEAAETHGFSRDLKSDKPGRAFATSGSRRAAIEPRKDPHQLAKEKFAERLAAALEKASGDGRFKRLVVVAPPRMLGALRRCFSPHLSEMVVGELAKDLNKLDPAMLAKQFRNLLAPLALAKPVAAEKRPRRRAASTAL